MDKKTKFKLTAIKLATNKTPKIEDDKAVFEVNRDDANAILVALKEKDVLDYENTTGVKITALGKWKHWKQEVSREWDPDEISITDAKGDWVIKYEDRKEFIPSGEMDVEFYIPDNEKPIDVEYDEDQNKLTVRLWVISTKELEKSLEGEKGKEACQEAFFGFSTQKAVGSLTKSFNAMSEIEDLATEDVLDEKRAQNFRKNVRSTVNSMKQAIADSGVSKYLEPDEIDTVVKTVTGRSLKLVK